MHLIKNNKVCIFGFFACSVFVISQLYGSFYSRIQRMNIIQNGIFSGMISKVLAYEKQSPSGNKSSDVIFDTYLNNSAFADCLKDETKYAMSDGQIGNIQKVLPANGNLIIWGSEKCSPLWNNFTTGRVILIADDTNLRKGGTRLHSESIQKYRFLTEYRVHYKISSVKLFRKYINRPELWHDLDLSDQLPKFITQTHWHVIVIKTSLGCCGIGSRRFQSIYTSWKLANKGTHIFVNNFESEVEYEFTEEIFGKPRAVSVNPNTFSKSNKEAHFIVNSDNKFSPFTVKRKNEKEIKSNKIKSMQMNNDRVKHNWSLLLTVNDGYFDFFTNWRYFFIKLNISIPVYIIAEDNIVYNKLNDIKDIGMTIQRSEHISINRSVYYDSILYRKMVSARPKYILSFIQKGMNIIYSDLDSVWMKNPLPYFTGDNDIWSQVDSEPMKIYCTGFLAIKSNINTFKFIRRWQRSLNKRPYLNQPVFNKLLKYSSLKFKPLDTRLFPSGDLYFKRFSEKERAKVVVVHNNWIRGHENKLDRFKKFKLWFNDTIV